MTAEGGAVDAWFVNGCVEVDPGPARGWVDRTKKGSDAPASDPFLFVHPALFSGGRRRRQDRPGSISRPCESFRRRCRRCRHGRAYASRFP